MHKYDHKEIEKKWKRKWSDEKVYAVDKDTKGKKGNYYILDMFPYPSGDGLHMGHTESYTASDILYRYKRMQGYNVLHPQGFDSFGLPAENYAIKTGTPPAESTEINMSNFFKQWKMLGLGHDFSNLIATSDPDYYKWTQSLFGKFFQNDFVYRKTDTVNWCDSCNTVIANEQVEDGRCERCKSEIIQKEIPAWFFRITDFADDLISGLDTVDWPEHTKKKQVNWIGKSDGAEIDFDVLDSDKKITVFTTRPDTLFGATYMVLAPEHELVQQLKDQVSNSDEVDGYISNTQKKSELDRLESKEKTGVLLEGISAINPASQAQIPVFIADYVLAGYGTGAIMAVPAHDERDFEFAQKFDLPIKPVVAQITGQKDEPDFFSTGVYGIIQNENEEYLIQDFTNRGFYWWPGGTKEGQELDEETLRREITEETGYTNFEVGDMVTEMFIDYPPLKGEGFARGRKHLKFYKIQINSEEKVPLELTEQEIDFGITLHWKSESEIRSNIPDHPSRKPVVLSVIDQFEKTIAQPELGIVVNSGEFDGLSSQDAKSVITEAVGGRMKSTYRLRDWSISRQRYWGCPIPIVYDPEGQAHFVGEENLPWLLPTDVDFVPTGESPLSKSKELHERTEKLFGTGWKPEVDTMDTFVDSSWYFLRYPDTNNGSEFCSTDRLKNWLPSGVDLYIGGAEHTYMHLLYARYFTKAMNKMGLINFDEPFKILRHQGMVNDKDGKKMSKSKGNVVNPNDMVERFGADSVRTYMMFAAPLEDDVIWNEDNIVGTYRFIEKVFGLQDKLTEKQNDDIEKTLHKLIKAVGEQIEELKYNTAVSDMMKFVNLVNKEGGMTKDQLLRFVKLLSPYAPHVSDEIAESLGERTSLVASDWPEYDESMLADDVITIGVQINGKRRGDIQVSPDATEDDVMNTARANKNINKWVSGGEIKKVIYVPAKILNIVVA